MPFEECVADLIGQWIIQVNGKLYEFNVLTIIDTIISNLVELVRTDDKMYAHIAKNKPKSGCHDTRGQKDVYMTMGENV